MHLHVNSQRRSKLANSATDYIHPSIHPSSSMSVILSLLLLLGFSLHAYDARALAHHAITKEANEKPNPGEGGRVSIESSRPNEDESDNDVVEVKRRESESVERVGWKVPPHRKKGEAQPGFNLDYLPPKTHPPAHN